jgi:ParB-like chromosome segregation protein Spo0J
LTMTVNDLTSSREMNSLVSRMAPSSEVPLASPRIEATDCELVPISSLQAGDSPRVAGEDMQHVQLLAESYSELPPILVHRKTLRVIDGMHRLHAAVMRGEEKIRAKFYDGSEEAAFVIAVEANTLHGLPLSLADREAAAARIVTSHPQWSDRAIAVVVGLSPKTVGNIRRDEAPNQPELRSRIGRDGRVRPLSSADGRRRASDLFALRPNASLREVARDSGISPGTASDVRERIRRGEDPVPPRQQSNAARGRPLTPERQIDIILGRISHGGDREMILRSLRHDPSVRMTESGRNLLRWLDGSAIGATGWESAVDSIPPHCAYFICDLACAIAKEWLDVAAHMRRRAETMTDCELTSEM